MHTYMKKWIYLQFWWRLERNSQSDILPTAELQLLEKIKQSQDIYMGRFNYVPQLPEPNSPSPGRWARALRMGQFLPQHDISCKYHSWGIDAVRHDENLFLLFFYSWVSQFSSSMLLLSEELLVVCVFCFAFKACPWKMILKYHALTL